ADGAHGEAEPTRTVRAHGRWRLHPLPPRAVAPAPTPAPAPARPGPTVRVPVSGPTRRATLVMPDRDHITIAVQRSGTYYERDLLDAIRARGRRGMFVDVG